MSLSVIDKYVEKKKKDILDYAKILESIITIEDNKMWNNKTEFVSDCKEVISIYTDKFYFDNNVNRDNPINYSNDNINLVLQAILDYCNKIKEPERLKTYKNETFLLTVIVCTAAYLDIATNVVDGNFVDTKNKFKYLLKYLQKTKILKVYANDRIRINELFEIIKKNIKEDNKFFDYFKFDNCFNEYNIYVKEPLLYNVVFNYKIDNLEEFDKDLVAKVKKSFLSKFANISNNLLVIDILKELISNKEMGTYLIKIDETMSKKVSLLKVFDNEILKKYVRILVPYEQMSDYNDVINEIEKMGIKIIYEYYETGLVNINKFNYDLDVIVYSEFIKNNEENKYTWDKNGINFIVKDKEE